jgi:hypothetical protein
MAQISTDATQMFQNAYGRSKDLIGTVADESRAAYKDVRKWVPQHPTAVAVSASAALSLGALGYALGRRRGRTAARRESLVSTAIARAPQLAVAPFFRFLKLWMLYRIATKA